MFSFIVKSVCFILLGAFTRARVHFTGFGDWGLNTPELEAVVYTMNEYAQNPDFVLLMGDNFYYPHGVRSVNDKRFVTLFEEVVAKYYIGPFLPSLGNHDYDGKPSAQIAYSEINHQWQMPKRYYMKRFENDGVVVCVFTVDTNYMKANDDQARWLDETLGSDECSDPYTWRVVTGHHPLYSSLTHDGLYPSSSILVPILHRHNVALYLCGHEHLHTIFYDGRLTQVTSGASALTRPAVQFSYHEYQMWGLSGPTEQGYVDVVATGAGMRVKIVCAQNGRNYQDFTIPRNGANRQSIFGLIDWDHNDSNRASDITKLPEIFS